jgi:hypothetical protein
MRLPPLVAVVSMVLAACERAPAPTPHDAIGDAATRAEAAPSIDPLTDATLVAEPVEVHPDQSGWELWTPFQDAFLDRHRSLRRVGGSDGMLLYAAGTAEVIDTERWRLPSDHVLHLDTLESDVSARDRVLVRMRLPGDGRLAFIVHTQGGSGDPAFYVTADSSASWGEVEGEILAIPASGEMEVYQLSNSMYAKRKHVRMENGRLVDVVADRYEVGLRTVALTRVPLTEDPHGGAMVATLAAGDSVLVIETTDRSSADGMPFLVQSTSGKRGWARISMMQCFAQVLRGICYKGD